MVVQKHPDSHVITRLHKMFAHVFFNSFAINEDNVINKAGLLPNNGHFDD